MNVSCLLLNYNDSDRILKQANFLKDTNIFNEIVIVDNNSYDIERNKLFNNNKEKFAIIYSSQNKGYGAGNNLGLNYLLKKQCDYVFLINPDIEIKKESIDDMLRFIKKHNEIASVTCPFIEKGKLKRNYYDFHNLKNSFFDSVTIEKGDLNILYKKNNINERRKMYFKMSKKCKSMIMHNDYLTADFVRESNTFYNMKIFSKIGFFDEEFFLYHEGAIISLKFKENGYSCAMLFNTFPARHNHLGTLMNRATFNEMKKSRILFFKKYLKYGFLKLLLIRLLWINVYLK